VNADTLKTGPSNIRTQVFISRILQESRVIWS
jgi:hypothetical protein